MNSKIFEIIGKWSLTKHFFSFFFLILFFCFGSLFGFLFWKSDQLQKLSCRIKILYEIRNSSLGKRFFKKNFLAQYQTTDVLFCEKNLESLSLLSEETKDLQELLQHPAFCLREDLHQRLQFLQSKQNQIQCKKENVRTSQALHEEELSLLHPVEINQQDLENILSIVEGVEIGSHTFPPLRPQLMMQKFDLQKKKTKEGKETFLLNFRCLKREFYKRNCP